MIKIPHNGEYVFKMTTNEKELSDFKEFLVAKIKISNYQTTL